MRDCESDSSGDEDNSFTETDVLLGYASTNPEGETSSRLGGHAKWLNPKKPPSASLARCKICKDMMVLLLQLNGELPERFPGHERVLYIFTCRRKTCRRKEGSVRALRGLRIAEDELAVRDAAATKRDAGEEVRRMEERRKKAEETKLAGTPKLGEVLFGAKSMGGATPAKSFLAGSSGAPANPFSMKGSDAATAPANPLSKPAAAQPDAADPQATWPPHLPSLPNEDCAVTDLCKTLGQTVALNSPPCIGPVPTPEPWPSPSSLPQAYPISWLSDADYETLDPDPAPNTVVNMCVPMNGDRGSSSGKEDKEVFESAMDADFQRFADRIGQNPEQCIRYEFGGQPLLYSRNDTVGTLLHGGGRLPPCANCGSERQFEVQLTPRAIEVLEREEDGLDGMEWGTVIVGVCGMDCQARGVGLGEVGYLEEWTGVQWEEIVEKK